MIPLNKTTIILGSFVVLLLLLSIQTYRAERLKDLKMQAEEEREQAISMIKTQTSATVFYVNKYKQQVAKTQETELSLGNLKKLRDTERIKFINKIDGLNKKLSNLINASNTSLTFKPDSIRKTIVTLPCKNDSIKAFLWTLNDEFNNISAMVIDTPTLQIKVPIYTADYWQREKKFLFFRYGPKIYYRETVSPNKLVKIESQEYFTIKKGNKGR